MHRSRRLRRSRSTCDGIALQRAVAAPLLLLARRWPRSLAGLACSAVGGLFVVRGLFYLVTSVHHGVGDGRVLRELLEADRGGVRVGSRALIRACQRAVEIDSETCSNSTP